MELRKGGIDKAAAKERWRQPSGRMNGYDYFDLSLFADIEMPNIDPVPETLLDRAAFSALEQRQRLDRLSDPLYRELVDVLKDTRNASEALGDVAAGEPGTTFKDRASDFRTPTKLQVRR